MISLAASGAFTEAEPAPLRVGMLIAGVYRLRVTHIALNPGKEVFPTVEVIDRLYPPRGFETRFAIPIELTQEDLELAIGGRFVTRVIYLEDPQQALPINQDAKHTQWFDAGPGNDPLRLADNLGRPVAILRIGGRVPLEQPGADPLMVGRTPALLRFGRPQPSQLIIEPDRPRNQQLDPASPKTGIDGGQ